MEEGRVVIDMRNNYECLIGHFEGAYLPKADTFRGAIDEVVEMLKDRKEQEEASGPGNFSTDQGGRRTEILLYCTGGIRCEKASAYSEASRLHEREPIARWHHRLCAPTEGRRA
jgi:UPF0176 protein